MTPWEFVLNCVTSVAVTCLTLAIFHLVKGRRRRPPTAGRVDYHHNAGRY